MVQFHLWAKIKLFIKFFKRIIKKSFNMGGFWPKMNANGRLDTCELNAGNLSHSERVRKIYNCALETGIKSRIKVI